MFIQAQFMVQFTTRVKTFEVTNTFHVNSFFYGCRWDGSLYQMIWRDFLCFAGFYYLIFIVYLYADLSEFNKRYSRLHSLSVH